MKKLIIIGLFAAVPSIGIMACKERGENGANRTDSAYQMMSDAQLANSIKSRLDADAQLNSANIKVDANKDKKIATLSGTVESESLRNRAVDLAKNAQPELMIQDQMEIAPAEVSRNEYTEQLAKEEWAKAKQLGEKVGNRLDDAWIHGKIVAKLVALSEASPRTVNVDVSDNVVTLRGTVKDSGQKAEAERIAKETDGVKRVDNRLEVSA